MIDTEDYNLQRQNFSLHEFYLPKFGRGLSTFNGNLVRPIYQAIQTPESETLSGWGCGIFCIQNVLATLGINARLNELIGRSIIEGAHPEHGMGWEPTKKVYQHFDLLTQEVVLKDISDLEAIINKGGVVQSSGTVGDMGCSRSGQTYDGHWFVVNGAGRGEVAVIDSDLRDKGVGNLSFGTYSLAWADFWRRCTDFDMHPENGFVSESGDFIWGNSHWTTERVVQAIYRK